MRLGKLEVSTGITDNVGISWCCRNGLTAQMFGESWQDNENDKCVDNTYVYNRIEVK